jgi:hypothetical protein
MADPGIAAMLEAAEADFRKALTNVELKESELARAHAAHAQAQEQLARMEATCAWLRERAQELSTEDDAGAVEAPESVSAEAAKPGAAPTRKRFGKPVPEITNSDLCVRALEQIGKAATTRDVREKIREFGYELDQEQVRGSLKYLAGRKDGIVQNPQPGVWLLRKEGTAAPSGNGAARTAQVPIASGARRTVQVTSARGAARNLPAVSANGAARG